MRAGIRKCIETTHSPQFQLLDAAEKIKQEALWASHYEIHGVDTDARISGQILGDEMRIGFI